MSHLARGFLLGLLSIPYAWYGIRDVLFHKTERAITWTEKALHATIGLAVLLVVSHAYQNRVEVYLLGLALLFSARSLDEFFFHHGIPTEEIHLHAKTHFAVLVLVIGIKGINYVDSLESGRPGTVVGGLKADQPTRSVVIQGRKSNWTSQEPSEATHVTARSPLPLLN